MKNAFSLPFIATLLGLVSLSSLGDIPNPPLALTAQRELTTGKEQVALVFRQNKVQLVVNSNFLGAKYWPVYLGVYEKDLDKTLRDLKIHLQADQMLAQKSKDRMKFDNRGPHRIQIFIGKDELYGNPSTRDRLKNILLSMTDRASQWKVVRGVKVEKGKKKFKVTNLKDAKTESISQRKCLPSGACVISQWGSVYIK